jgi:hypothetical protein
MRLWGRTVIRGLAVEPAGATLSIAVLAALSPLPADSPSVGSRLL